MERNWPEQTVINPRGAHSGFADYEPRDAVTFEGATYLTRVAITAAEAITPPDDPWELLAGKGADSTGSGHVIRNPDGDDMPQRAKLHFDGIFLVTDSAGDNETVVALPPPVKPTQADIESIIGTTFPFDFMVVTADFTVDPDGVGPLRGLDKGGVTHLGGTAIAATTGEKVISTLEALYRPDREVRFPVAKTNGVLTVVKVLANGQVRVNLTAFEEVHLDGISFPSGLAFGGVPIGVAPDYRAPWEAGDPPVLIHRNIIEGKATGFAPGTGAAFDFVKPEILGTTWSGFATWSDGSPASISVQNSEFFPGKYELRVNDTGPTPLTLGGRIDP
jgi:hypothetical protein